MKGLIGVKVIYYALETRFGVEMNLILKHGKYLTGALQGLKESDTERDIQGYIDSIDEEFFVKIGKQDKKEPIKEFLVSFVLKEKCNLI